MRINIFSASIRGRFGSGPENYGDNLMGVLLPELFNMEPNYVGQERAELIGAGSILDAYHRRTSRRNVSFVRRRPWRTLHVWGSGFMNSDGRALWPQSIRIHAVRGPLSLDKLTTKNVATGDPAVLLPLVKPRSGALTNAVAVIPHFATYAEFMARFGSNVPRHWKILNLLDDPERITAQIFRSECVISSSLHGLIVADAYGIPSCRMVPGQGIKGDGFKYCDYEAFRGRRYPPPTEFEACLQLKDQIHKLMDQACPPSGEAVHRLMASFPQ